jgi:hypothetical protein
VFISGCIGEVGILLGGELLEEGGRQLSSSRT